MGRTVLWSCPAGKWFFNHPTGKLQARGDFVATDFRFSRGTAKIPMETGKWQYFYPNGNLMAEGFYSGEVFKRYEYEPEKPKKRFFDFLRSKWKREIPILPPYDLFGTSVGEWKYYDETGKFLTDKDEISAAVEAVRQMSLKLKKRTEPDDSY